MLKLIAKMLQFVTAGGPHCIRRPPPAPSLGVLDVLGVFGNPSPHGNSPSIAVFIMGITLFVMGYRTMYSTVAKSLPQYSSVRFCIGLYCFITGFFFFLLATNLNIIVVVAATLHNFIEWSILANLLLLQPDRRKYNAIAGVWCWFVVMVVLHIPDLLMAFEFEEVTGIWPDFFLILTAGYLKFKVHNPNRPLPYRFFLEGAAWHMIQIISLLCLGFGFFNNEVSGLIIFVTALPNYWYYSEFALYYDGMTKPPAFPLVFGSLFGFNDDLLQIAAQASADAPVVVHNINGDVRQAEDVFSTPAQYFSFRSLRRLLGIAFGLASLAVLVPPLTLKLCEDVGFSCLDTNTGNVWQLSLYKFSPTAVYMDVVRRSEDSNNLKMRLFAGKGHLDGYTLVLEKWMTKMAMVLANKESKFADEELHEHAVFRYSNFLQVETTGDFFSHCSDEDIQAKYKVAKVPFHKDPSNSFNWKLAGCKTNNVVGFTLASLSETRMVYGLDAMAYGLRSRFENGSISYDVFYGGANPGNEDPSFDASKGENMKIMVVERWQDEQTLHAHLEGKTVEYIHAVAGVTTIPTSVLLSSPFEEWLPQC